MGTYVYLHREYDFNTGRVPGAAMLSAQPFAIRWNRKRPVRDSGPYRKIPLVNLTDLGEK